MHMSPEEADRTIAEYGAALKETTRALMASMRLSAAQLEELAGVDYSERFGRAREMVAAEGRPWHREMDGQLDHLARTESFRRQVERPRTSPSAKVAAIREMAQRDRELRQWAQPLDDAADPQ